MENHSFVHGKVMEESWNFCSPKGYEPCENYGFKKTDIHRYFAEIPTRNIYAKGTHQISGHIHMQL